MKSARSSAAAGDVKVAVIAMMLFAHEMVHVWQWQNRHVTGYHPLKAAQEHNAVDPYLFDLSQAPKFLDYGFEQQGATTLCRCNRE